MLDRIAVALANIWLILVVRSRFRHRGLYANGPAGFDPTTPPGRSRLTGPRLTDMSLKGPKVTQPPPVPAGSTIGGSPLPAPRRMSGWLGMAAPLPDMEVSLPSNTGEVSRPVMAVRPQFQYYHEAKSDAGNGDTGGSGCSSYRLGAIVATLRLESLLIQPGEIPVPGEEVARVVDLHCLIDVCRDEVIEAVLNARCKRG